MELPAVTAPSRWRTAPTWVVIAVVMVLAVTALVLGAANKQRCAGPPFNEYGRSLNFDELKNSHVCYSDIQYLWNGRDIDNHVFPYVHGDITPEGVLVGGALEYPVLTGVVVWLGAIGQTTDAGFLKQSILILQPFGLFIALGLALLSRWRALLFVATPAIVLYAFHNWDLPAVAAMVAAVYLVERGPWSMRTRGVLGAVVLSIGACLKLYPGIFVLPLMLLVLTRGKKRDDTTRWRGYDWWGAAMVAGAAIATAVLVYLPFVLAGWRGVRASFVFQSLRQASIDTNSIWFWSFGSTINDEQLYNEVVDVVSPILVLAAFALAAGIGWRIHRRGNPYPWIPVSGAMLCAFLLLHKVHSPQYMLWLLPFFVLVKVPWRLLVPYLICDVCIGVGVFWYFAGFSGPGTGASDSLQITTSIMMLLGIWGRAALLAILIVRMPHYPSAVLDSRQSTDPPQSPARTDEPRQPDFAS